MTDFIGRVNSFFNKFKIPTLLGLSIILFGTGAGVYLVVREQTFLSQAAPNSTPQNITFTNITENGVVISWQTVSPAISFISFGQVTSEEQTSLDDRDTNTPKPHLTHYVTLKNLLPKTKYQFKIISGKKPTDTLTFETTEPPKNQTGFTVVIGSVLDGDTSLDDGIAYLSIPGANTQSSLIKLNGNFLIPISSARKEDLSDIFPITSGTTAKITVISDKGNATVLFKLQLNLAPLPPLRLGQDIDLTTVDQVPSATPFTENLKKYDLNGDGKINVTDNAIILDVISKKTTNKNADLNGDGKIDQKDLDLMSQHINQ